MNPKPNPYNVWPPAVSSSEYNDELAVEAYLNHFKNARWFLEQWLMTKLEVGCLNKGNEYRKIQSIKKMNQRTGNFTKGMKNEILRVETEWNSDANADVRVALGDVREPDELRIVLNGFYDLIKKPVDQMIEAGELPINRCPACSRVVRTPTAKQCMWCKHDWH